MASSHPTTVSDMWHELAVGRTRALRLGGATSIVVAGVAATALVRDPLARASVAGLVAGGMATAFAMLDSLRTDPRTRGAIAALANYRRSFRTTADRALDLHDVDAAANLIRALPNETRWDRFDRLRLEEILRLSAGETRLNDEAVESTIQTLNEVERRNALLAVAVLNALSTARVGGDWIGALSAAAAGPRSIASRTRNGSVTVLVGPVVIPFVLAGGLAFLAIVVAEFVH